MDFTRADYHRFKEHCTVDEFLYFIDSLLLGMTEENLFKNLSRHTSDVSQVHFLNLLETVFKLLLRLLLSRRILIECLFGKSHDDFIDELVYGIRSYLTNLLSLFVIFSCADYL